MRIPEPVAKAWDRVEGSKTAYADRALRICLVADGFAEPEEMVSPPNLWPTRDPSRRVRLLVRNDGICVSVKATVTPSRYRAFSAVADLEAFGGTAADAVEALRGMLVARASELLRGS